MLHITYADSGTVVLEDDAVKSGASFEASFEEPVEVPLVGYHVLDPGESGDTF